MLAWERQRFALQPAAATAAVPAAPEVAPAPTPAPSASPAPAPAPAPAPSGGTWKPTAGPTTGHPLTWRIGVPPTVAVADLEEDPPSAGVTERVIRIDYPPEVRVIREVVPVPVATVTPVLAPVYATHVLFDTNRWDMSPVAQVTLKIAAQRALAIPGSRIGVAAGHADVTGNKQRNRQLAQNRAESVIAFLVGYGYPRDQIEVVNEGDDSPLFSGRTARDHQGNRRVDVTVVGVVK